MTLKSQMDNDMVNVFLNTNDFADADCVYTTALTGATVTTDASFDLEDMEETFEREGQWGKRRGEVLVRKAKVPDPQRGDTITNEDGYVFTVEKVNSEDSVSFFLQIVEKTRKSLGVLQRR